ncbi:MAG TPA: transposase [Lacipirellulaceae bacterium]|nr:transposase [Lacipirellulaceae bacterium]
MPNYRRNFFPGGTFFFTVVTHYRRPILTSAIGRRSLRQAFAEVRGRRPITIDAIVLLPDHLHCVWTLPQGDAAFDVRWRQIKARFTQLYLYGGGKDAGVSAARAIKGEHGVWQPRYFEHTVRDETDLKHCVDYVHINPLKHGLVQRVRDWPWSSFHRYVHLGEYSIDWGGTPIFFGDEWNRFE